MESAPPDADQLFLCPCPRTKIWCLSGAKSAMVRKACTQMWSLTSRLCNAQWDADIHSSMASVSGSNLVQEQSILHIWIWAEPDLGHNSLNLKPSCTTYKIGALGKSLISLNLSFITCQQGAKNTYFIGLSRRWNEPCTFAGTWQVLNRWQPPWGGEWEKAS